MQESLPKNIYKETDPTKSSPIEGKLVLRKLDTTNKDDKKKIFELTGKKEITSNVRFDIDDKENREIILKLTGLDINNEDDRKKIIELNSKTKNKQKTETTDNKQTILVPVPIYEDQNGNLYCEKLDLKEKQDFEMERFIATISKGVLHVSDVVRLPDGIDEKTKENKYKYLSKIMDLDKIEGKPGEDAQPEVKAEIFLLNYLFEEMDKASGEKRKTEGEKVGEAQNININPKTSSFAHYDFGDGFRKNDNDKTFWYERNQKAESLIPGINYQLNNIYKYDIAPKGRPTKLPDNNIPSKETEAFIKQKALMFRENIRDSNFFNVVVKKSDIKKTEDGAVEGKTEYLINSERFNFLNLGSLEDRTQELQKMILERLDVLIKVLELREQK